PELPEVETVRRGLDRSLLRRRLQEVELARHDLRWPIPVAACHDLRGRRCVAISRRSKYLLLHFDGATAPVALIHLGMSGRLWVERRRDLDAWRTHEHWRMHFGPLVLRYADPRRFGVLDVVTGNELGTHRLLCALGPEPLGEEFDAAYLFRRTRQRRVATKLFLMDAKNVVGIGNIYASEICHAAGVRPRRGAHRLSRDDCARLAIAVRTVLSRALAAGGTTIRDYIGADEDTGYFQHELRVYDRAGLPCVACGAAIRQTVDGGRSTYYCPTCQR
ncbi:MAG: bifunctional DNA-formamidopyrimidine glycosylase/DNA-(apurinic or apyrimidinic site) lyase, partial [Planctomycetes bacterium]|nr:bifunctional DNA-formamidopyrimidine glycosylase/DNA-(apurinic or apyrimidinic site) lyase [Planctomycetota bacterium]